MHETNDPDVLAYADEIRQYLDSRPNAADTLSGVVWWLAKSKLEQNKLKIQLALEYLVEKGVVVRMHSNGRKQSSESRAEADPGLYTVYALNSKGTDVSN